MSGLKPFIAPALTAVSTLLTGSPILGSLAGGAASSMKPKAPPEITPPATMPDMNDEQVRQAKRRQIAEIQARSGRASTILTGGDKLGG